MGLHTWSYQTRAGTPDGWLMLGWRNGRRLGGATIAMGYDLFSFMVARKAIIEARRRGVVRNRVFPAARIGKSGRVPAWRALDGISGRRRQSGWLTSRTALHS